MKLLKVHNLQKILFRSHHVCVIGSGPAGLYVAQHLLKLNKSTRVDVFEKLPVPFGLVRYGVAPDHPEVKNVINSFNNTLTNERCRFIGNVQVGSHVSLQDLKKSYNAIVLCYGATSDNLLGLENEDLITSAREFVGWYNGLPSTSNLNIDLSKTSKILVIGHGNVALDVARILLTDTKNLENTDIADYALEQLKKSKVQEIVVVGRRGVLNVAFTIKEFREMVKLQDVSWGIDLEGHEFKTEDLPRPRKRLTDLIVKSSETSGSRKPRHWCLKFLRSPVSVNKTEDGRISVRFEVNKLENDKVVGTGTFEDITCDVVFRSIGYKGTRVFPELPFDEKTGVVAHVNGKVAEGIYCSGWAAQGPRGVILTTMQHAFEVAKTVNSDLEASGKGPKSGYSDLADKLRFSTNYNDFAKIAEWEKNNGGRKITSVSEMLRVCGKDTVS